ncbi:hypothetical protein ONZ45_g16213 [Pleurotus djamor]|nr:hypothetical protein ONZ45_g16213 [Pleurotus djamor]
MGAEENWEWFDTWGRRHKSMSIATDKYTVASATTDTVLDEDNVDKLAQRSSMKRFPSERRQRPPSGPKGTRRGLRIVSLGGITNATGTTSNSNLIIALPPKGNDDNMPSIQEGPRTGYYDPQLPRPVTSTPSTVDDALTTAGVRNARLLFVSSPE